MPEITTVVYANMVWYSYVPNLKPKVVTQWLPTFLFSHAGDAANKAG